MHRGIRSISVQDYSVDGHFSAMTLLCINTFNNAFMNYWTARSDFRGHSLLVSCYCKFSCTWFFPIDKNWLIVSFNLHSTGWPNKNRTFFWETIFLQSPTIVLLQYATVTLQRIFNTCLKNFRLLFSAVISEHQQKPHDYICSGCKISYLKNVRFLLDHPVLFDAIVSIESNRISRPREHGWCDRQ